MSLSSLQDGYLTFYLDDGTNSHQQVLLRPEDNRDLNDWRWHKISVERMGRHVRNTSLGIFIVRRGWGWGGVQFSGFCCEYKQTSKKIHTVVYTLIFVTLDISGGRVGGGGGCNNRKFVVNIHVYCKCTTSQIFIHIVCTLTMLNIGLFK